MNPKDYAYPQYDRRIFDDRMVERNDICMALERIYAEATEHYKTNTYVVESVAVVPFRDRDTVDLYVTIRR